MLDTFFSTRYSLRERRPVQRWTLGLDTGVACDYWRVNDGCTMCGFNTPESRTTSAMPSAADIRAALLALAEDAQAQSVAEVFLYNGGSFFNDHEVSPAIRREVLRTLSECVGVGRLLVESRCEYLTRAKIEASLSQIGDQVLTVAIGLESQDDRIRNQLLRKGLARTHFEKQVRLLRDLGVQPFAYVFLKPVGLTEKEAIAEGLATIDYALAVGVEEIELSSAFVQAGTRMAQAYAQGHFRPPSLWSILHLIDEIERRQLPVSIGGFDDIPPPIAIPTSCPGCSPAIYEAIDAYRTNRVLGPIPSCHCREAWQGGVGHLDAVQGSSTLVGPEQPNGRNNIRQTLAS